MWLIKLLLKDNRDSGGAQIPHLLKEKHNHYGLGPKMIILFEFLSQKATGKTNKQFKTKEGLFW